jgi:integrase
MGQRGSVRIESGSWYGYFNTYIWDDTRDKKIRKQKSVKLGPAEGRGKLTKWDAYAELAKEIEKARGTSQDPVRDGSITLERFAETRWLPLREGKLRKGSKESLDQNLKHIYKQFGSKRLDQLDKVALQNWLNKIAHEYSDGMVKHLKFYLNSILEEAVEQEFLSKNPAKKLEMPRTKRVSKDVLTAEQFKAVLSELKSPYDLIVKIAIACAFRPSELLALRWKDLDEESKTFTIRETIYRGELRPFTKTTEAGETDKSLLTVPVPDALIAELLEYRGNDSREGHRYKVVSREPKVIIDMYMNDDDFIFHNLENGNFLGKENILFRIFDPIEKKLNLKLNFQVLRRTAATLAQSKGSVKDVQSLLRHRSPDITAEVYMQIVPETARKMQSSVYEDLTKTKKEA